MEEKKEKIQKLILKKWEEVHPYVGEESYVIDFCYFPSKDEVTVIELSPFRTCTGAACFRWTNEDGNFLLYKNIPFFISII